MTSVRSSDTPRVLGGEYKHTTPELRAARQAAVAKYVDRYYRDEDERARQAIQSVGAGAAAAIGAGVIIASQLRGPAAPPPGSAATPTVGAPERPALVAAPETAASAIAEEAVQGVYHRQDGKKADTLREATPAFRFRAGLGRPLADQVFTSERVDNAARVDRHVEGRTIDGRGPASLFFGRSFQAPELPPLKNFEPVVK